MSTVPARSRPEATTDAARVAVHKPEYRHASKSIAPWFTHKRMIPKWTGLFVTAIVAVLFPAPLQLVLFLIGVALFFPSEYIVHRGVFHFFADKNAGKVLSKQHVEHHKRPDDLDYLFNDPRISVSIGLLYFAAHRPGSKPWTPWSRFMKKWHLWHHFKHERLWFGVTSPVFDFALKSYKRHTDVEPSPTVRTLVPTAEQEEWMRR